MEAFRDWAGHLWSTKYKDFALMGCGDLDELQWVYNIQHGHFDHLLVALDVWYELPIGLPFLL